MEKIELFAGTSEYIWILFLLIVKISNFKISEIKNFWWLSEFKKNSEVVKFWGVQKLKISDVADNQQERLELIYWTK